MVHYMDIYYEGENKPFAFIEFPTMTEMNVEEFEITKNKVVQEWATVNGYEMVELEWC